MSTYTFDPTIQRATVIGISFKFPKIEGAALTPPVALTAPEVVEIEDLTGVKQYGSNFLNLTTGDTVDFYQCDLGYSQTGKPAVSAPSPVYSHTVVAASVRGFQIKPLLKPGTGKLIAVGINGATPRAVVWSGSEANALSFYNAPSINAYSLSALTNIGRSLYETIDVNSPAFINGASEEHVNRVISRELHAVGGMSREVNGSSETISGETVPPDPVYEQFIKGGGDYAIDPDGNISGGYGYVKGLCQNPFWMSLFKASVECGKLATVSMVAKSTPESTTIASDSGNVPFNFMQEVFAPFDGLRPVTYFVNA